MSIYTTILSSVKPVKHLYLLNFVLLLIGNYVLLLLGDSIAKEYIYDDFHLNNKSTYQLNFTLTVHEEPTKLALVPGIIPDDLKEQFDAINEIAKFNAVDSKLVFTHNKKNIIVDKVLKTNSDFFKVFTFPMLSGDEKTALDETGSIVLTKELNDKLFPDQDGIGQTIVINGENYLVTGVLKNIPNYSTIRFEALMSYSNQDLIRENWSHTFVSLKANTNLSNFRENITGWIKMGMDGFYDKDVVDVAIGITPFSSLHKSESLFFDLDKANLSVLYLQKVLFVILFIFILFNYTINIILLTQRRIKTYAVKNIFGATKTFLVKGVFIESIFFICITAIIAYLTTLITNQELGSYGLSGPIEWSLVYTLFLFVCLSLLIFVPLIFSGLLIVRLKSREALARKYQGVTKFQSLVTLSLQAVVTLVIMNVTMGISSQIAFLLNKDLGFEYDNLIILNLYKDDNVTNHVTKFINELESQSSVASVTRTLRGSLPGTRTDVEIGLSDFEYGETRKYDILEVGENFIETFNIGLVEGRTLDFANRQNEILVNESFVKEYEINNPINYYFDGGKIVGVVKNFNYTSLHKEIKPLVINKIHSKGDYLVVKVNNMASISNVLNSIENLSKDHFNGIKLEHHFLEDMIDNLYSKEVALASLLNFYLYLVFSLVVLGVFSVSLYETSRNQNEMIIRKIFGASTRDLFFRLVKSPVILIIIACIVSLPISYFIFEEWLNNFEYKIQKNYFPYIINSAIIIIMVFAFFLIGFYYQALKNSSYLKYQGE